MLHLGRELLFVLPSGLRGRDTDIAVRVVYEV